MRIVFDSFLSGGIRLNFKQILRMMDRVVQDLSEFRRLAYVILSLPGAEFSNRESLVATSHGVNGDMSIELSFWIGA